VTAALRVEVARALSIVVEDIDAEKTLADYGTDSLMTVELRSWMAKLSLLRWASSHAINILKECPPLGDKSWSSVVLRVCFH